MQRKVHRFDNGILVYEDHLIPVQKERYKKHNVHEAEEEDIFIHLIKSLPPKGCFVNVGSAIGYYPLLALKLAPGLKIIALEPLKLHRRWFRENLALNGFFAGDITLRREGLYSSKGYRDFLEQGYGSKVQLENRKDKEALSGLQLVNHLLRKNFFLKNRRKDKKISMIKTITLDQFILSLKQPVDLLQMDVQGIEQEVLLGGENTLEEGTVKTFLIGTHNRNLHRKCIKLLEGFGYRVEYDLFDTVDQPDGIIVASKSVYKLENYSRGEDNG